MQRLESERQKLHNYEKNLQDSERKLELLTQQRADCDEDTVETEQQIKVLWHS